MFSRAKPALSRVEAPDRNSRSRSVRVKAEKTVRFGESLEGELPAQAEESPLAAAEVAEWGLSHFVRLTAQQRSCVILKDVLSYRLEEISEILDVSVPSIKGALHRGRANLRRQAAAGEAQPARPLPQEQAALLGRYVALFNARDFDALRAMLAEDVQLELVAMTEKSRHGRRRLLQQLRAAGRHTPRAGRRGRPPGDPGARTARRPPGLFSVR